MVAAVACERFRRVSRCCAASSHLRVSQVHGHQDMGYICNLQETVTGLQHARHATLVNPGHEAASSILVRPHSSEAQVSIRAAPAGGRSR